MLNFAHYFMPMMIKKQSKLQWVLMLLVAGLLMFITESFFMSLGIFLLLIVADYVIVDKVDDYLRRKKRRKEDNEV